MEMHTSKGRREREIVAKRLTETMETNGDQWRPMEMYTSVRRRVRDCWRLIKTKEIGETVETHMDMHN